MTWWMRLTSHFIKFLNMHNMLNMVQNYQYAEYSKYAIPADRLRTLQSNGVSVLLYHQNDSAVLVFNKRAKKMSLAFMINTQISCSIIIITLSRTMALLLVYNWHPTHSIPTWGLCTEIFLYVEQTIWKSSKTVQILNVHIICKICIICSKC